MYTKLSQAKFLIRSDIAVGIYTLTIDYVDDNGMTNTHVKTIEATDKCITAGLQGVPGNEALSMEYVI